MECQSNPPHQTACSLNLTSKISRVLSELQLMVMIYETRLDPISSHTPLEETPQVEHKYDWQVLSSYQRVYLFACVLQFVVEIIFYETTECLFMSFIIPDLVRNEVQSAAFSLCQTVQRLCFGLSTSTTSLAVTSSGLNSKSLLPISLFPRLSFLSHPHPPLMMWSRNVASYFPHSLASTLVASSAEDFRASYLGKPSSLTGGRDRVNSMESSGSLPYRMRGSSVDSVGVDLRRFGEIPQTKRNTSMS